MQFMDNRPLSKLGCWIVRLWLYLMPTIYTIYSIVALVEFFRTHDFEFVNLSVIGRYVIVFCYYRSAHALDKQGFSLKFARKSLWLGLAVLVLFLYILVPQLPSHPPARIGNTSLFTFLCVFSLSFGAPLAVVFRREFFEGLFNFASPKKETPVL